jgi:hypothetical protein
MVLSKSHPQSLRLPFSLTSMRTVAASVTIQPNVMASRNGMHRLTVCPEPLTPTDAASTGGKRRNQSGIACFAGIGGAMTPRSSGSQRKLITRGAGSGQIRDTSPTCSPRICCSIPISHSCHEEKLAPRACGASKAEIQFGRRGRFFRGLLFEFELEFALEFEFELLLEFDELLLFELLLEFEFELLLEFEFELLLEFDELLFDEFELELPFEFELLLLEELLDWLELVDWLTSE